MTETPEIKLTTAFGTAEPGVQEEIRRLLQTALERVAQEGTFRRARAVFTESDEQCVLTLELDGVRREASPLVLGLDEVESAVDDPAGGARLTEAVRGYCRRVLGLGGG